MIELFSIQFWIAILFIINFLLVVFLFLFVKRVNQLRLSDAELLYNDADSEEFRQEESGPEELRSGHSQYASESASNIIEMLEPLVEESIEISAVI